MPHILAIDTSTDACSVALLTPSGIYQSFSVSPREHTQKLLPSIEGLLAEHQLSLKQFDAIAVSAGPGSFTGLRIGLSTAQGLAYGADLPLIPISTLKTMAQTALRLKLAKVSDIIVPVIDARMNEVYWSAYSVESDESENSSESLGLTSLCEELIENPEKLSLDNFASKNESVNLEGQIDVIGVGSGWHYPCLQTYDIHQKVVEFYPQAEDVALLASTALKNHQTISPLEALPVYMRDEVSWKKRQRIRG